MANRATDSAEDLGAHSLFVGMREEYVEGVVSSIIGNLGRASPDSRRAFEGELDKQNLRIPGFRSASRAPSHLLTQPVQVGVLHSDELAAAVLRLWAESNRDLYEAVFERLNDIGAYIGISADFPDSDGKRLSGHWPGGIWERERSLIAGLHADADENDIELMMCYLSGRLPAVEESEDDQDGDPGQSPAIVELLEKCAIELEELPVAAPEWDSAIPCLAGKIADVVAAKREERSRAATLDSYMEEVRNDFSEELAYLEFDVTSWSADRLPTGDEVARALGLCEELRSTLAELRAVRESAPGATRSAERERRNRNDELEDEAIGGLDRIGRLMSGEPAPDDDPPGRAAHAEEQTGGADVPDGDGGASSQSRDAFPVFESEQLYRENLSLQSERDELRGENEGLRVEVLRLEAQNSGLDGEIASLRSENRTLKNDVQFIRADKDEIEGKLESLRSELTDKASEVETWRRAYEDESQIPRLTVEDVPQQVEHVSDAVAYARVMFKDTMLLKLNSKSEVQDNPFVKPQDVWDALQWLATAYHGARAGVASIPDFDVSLREACGWQYRSGQGQTTLNKYREWYTTKANGRTYRLAEHLAKGASKDARHTIRIAFDWDNDEKVVVVGYIGQHQETDAT